MTNASHFARRCLGPTALGIAVATALAAAGCGEKSEPSIHPPTTAPPTTTAPTTSTAPTTTTTPAKPPPTGPIPKQTP